MQHGDKVICLADGIDKKRGKNEVGYVTGFARLSHYHPREVYVSNTPEGPPTADWCGWFWESSVRKHA